MTREHYRTAYAARLKLLHHSQPSTMMRRRIRAPTVKRLEWKRTWYTNGMRTGVCWMLCVDVKLFIGICICGGFFSTRTLVACDNMRYAIISVRHKSALAILRVKHYASTRIIVFNVKNKSTSFNFKYSSHSLSCYSQKKTYFIWFTWRKGKENKSFF